MRALAERAYFRACLTLGALLRSARYSRTRVAGGAGGRHVRKRRMFYAPLLIALVRPVFKMLNTGVRVLSQREWEARERAAYRRLGGTAIHVESDGTLILPLLAGRTLADVLEHADAADRARAMELAGVALADLHAHGITHADAMAENVMVDLEAGVAYWFDFENVHDTERSSAWCRADDVRALVTTCVRRAAPGECVGMIESILDLGGDDEVMTLLASTVASVWRRSLTFHLGQAGVSFLEWREIARLLRERSDARRGLSLAMREAESRGSMGNGT